MHYKRLADLVFRQTSGVRAAIPAQRPSALPLHLYDPRYRQIVFLLADASRSCRVLGHFQILHRTQLRFTGEACIVIL